MLAKYGVTAVYTAMLLEASTKSKNYQACVRVGFLGRRWFAGDSRPDFKLIGWVDDESEQHVGALYLAFPTTTSRKDTELENQSRNVLQPELLF